MKNKGKNAHVAALPFVIFSDSRLILRYPSKAIKIVNINMIR